MSKVFVFSSEIFAAFKSKTESQLTPVLKMEEKEIIQPIIPTTNAVILTIGSLFILKV
jgi:hypothetical protein